MTLYTTYVYLSSQSAIEPRYQQYVFRTVAELAHYHAEVNISSIAATSDSSTKNADAESDPGVCSMQVLCKTLACPLTCKRDNLGTPRPGLRPRLLPMLKWATG
jgi:hypothetical protein